MEQFSFGYWLRRMRLAHGLRQAELAAQLGIATVTLRKIEADERRPSLQLAERLGQVLRLGEKDGVLLLRVVRGDVGPAALSLPSTTLHVNAAACVVRTARATRVRNELPVPPTALIGRAQELASLCRLVTQPAVRLVTLTGPGGTGKTRLALEAAHRLVDAFPDGVWLVNLAPLSDPARVLFAIAEQLDVRPDRERSLLEAVQAALHGKHLLVLDNFEHVLAAGLDLAHLLSGTRDLTVLVTSRAVLHLSGEHVVSVLPLETQGDASAAAQLFVERARAACTDYRLDAATQPVVAQICARLDGLPLAIELAAARVRVFTPMALLGRLERRLPFLAGGARDLPVRQQTLRDTIAWSYALLSGDEQALFRRMGVCAGECSFQAAEALSDMDRATTDGGPGGNAANRPTLNILAGLLDHSLIRAEEGPDGSTRFTMLETIREYALEQLEATGELARARACYFGHLLAEFAPLQFDIWRGARQVWALAQVGIELHNLRAALAWSIAPDHGDAPAARTLGLQLAAAIASYWVWRGPLSEGCEWFEHLLNGGEGLPDARAACMCGACLVFGFVDPPRAIAYGEQSVAFYRQQGDAIALAEALHCLGRALRQAGRAEQAWVAGQEALTLFRANDLANSTGWVLLLLGDCAQDQGDFRRAEQLLEEALILSRKAGDAIGEGYTLANLGRCAHALGQHEQALVLLEQGVTILERLGAPGGPEGVRESLAYVLAALGRVEQAAVLFADTLQFWWERGSRFHLPALFDGIAVIAAYRHDAQQAARLFGAAQSIRVNLAVAVLQAVAVDRERGIAAARATLGHEAFETCWQQGYRAPVADIVVQAIQYTDTVQPNDVAGG